MGNTFSIGKLLIWPENCILIAGAEFDRNHSSIDSSKISVTISINETNSGQTDTCQFHYVNYIQSDAISLLGSGKFKEFDVRFRKFKF